MTNEEIIKNYYTGWEKKDWDMVEATLADDFTFTSPYDTHIDKSSYKKRCWPGAASIGKFEFLTMMEKGSEAFARWRCIIGNKAVINTEYFLIEGGKIKKVEVFFGQPIK